MEQQPQQQQPHGIADREGVDASFFRVFMALVVFQLPQDQGQQLAAVLHRHERREITFDDLFERCVSIAGAEMVTDTIQQMHLQLSARPPAINQHLNANRYPQQQTASRQVTSKVIGKLAFALAGAAGVVFNAIIRTSGARTLIFRSYLLYVATVVCCLLTIMLKNRVARWFFLSVGFITFGLAVVVWVFLLLALW